MLRVPEGGLVDPRQAVVVQRQRPQGRHALERPSLDPADVVVVQLQNDWDIITPHARGIMGFIGPSLLAKLSLP